MKKKLTIDKYIEIGKSDISVYSIITIILLSISLYISVRYNFYGYLIFIGFMMVSRTMERIETYFTLKDIKAYLIENNLFDKIGSIDYWNEKSYFLTDNYIIIKKNKVIYSFEYSEIKKIFKERYKHAGKTTSFQVQLHIVTNDNNFKVLIYSDSLVGEDYKDIVDYLIKKNPNIKVDKTVKK